MSTVAVPMMSWSSGRQAEESEWEQHLRKSTLGDTCTGDNASQTLAMSMRERAVQDTQNTSLQSVLTTCNRVQI